MIQPVKKIIEKHISKIILAAIIAQPLLDVASFVFDNNSYFNVVPTIRGLILVLLALSALLISNRKRSIILAFGIIVAFFVFRFLYLNYIGYDNLAADLGMYIRVMQLPILVMSIVCILMTDTKVIKTLLLGVNINLFIISILTLLAFLTGTFNYTYESGSVGLIGWFSHSNGQGIIYIALSGLSLLYAHSVQKKYLFLLNLILSFGLMFAIGTRVAYFAIFAIGITWLITLLINKVRSLLYYIFLTTGMIVVGLAYPISPLAIHGKNVEARVTSWNRGSEKSIVAVDTDKSSNVTANDLIKEPNENEINKPPNNTEDEASYIYIKFLPLHIERFGIDAVKSAFNYTDDLGVIRDYRAQKNVFLLLTMSTSPLGDNLIGREYADFSYGGIDFEPENDYMTIVYLYGYLGAIFYAMFLIGAFGVVIYVNRKNLIKITSPFIAITGATALLMIGSGLLGGHVASRANVTFYVAMALSIMVGYAISNSNYGKKYDHKKA